SEIVDANDVLVRDLAREQKFLFESPFDRLRCVRVAGDFRADDFERDNHRERVVPCLVDRAHAAESEQSHDVISPAESLSADEWSALLGRGPGARTRTCCIAIGGTSASDQPCGVAVNLRRRSHACPIIIKIDGYHQRPSPLTCLIGIQNHGTARELSAIRIKPSRRRNSYTRGIGLDSGCTTASAESIICGKLMAAPSACH